MLFRDNVAIFLNLTSDLEVVEVEQIFEFLFAGSCKRSWGNKQELIDIRSRYKCAGRAFCSYTLQVIFHYSLTHTSHFVIFRRFSPY